MIATLGLSPLTSVAADGDGGSCTWLAPNAEGCTAPPEGLVAWWSLDEGAGAILAHDAVGDNHGWPDGDPQRGAGVVSGAWHFDGTGDLVRVPHDASLNPGVGDLSIDAWVRPGGGEVVHSIVDKRGLVNVTLVKFQSEEELDAAVETLEDHGIEVTKTAERVIEILTTVGDELDAFVEALIGEFGGVNIGIELRGYHFFIEYGVLAFEMNTAGASQTYYGPSVAIHDWTLVAVTVDRANPVGGTFYAHGGIAASFDPTSQQGSLDNLADAKLGRSEAAHPVYEDEVFGLDEVELFHRVLTPTEVGTLQEAGPAGKCRFDCENPEVVTYEVDQADPRPDIESHYTVRRDVGEGGVNKAFAHTFKDLPDDIIAATLEVQLVAQGELDYNDGIGLQYSGPVPPPKWDTWYHRIGTHGSVEGLLEETWGKFRDVSEHTFVFDLSVMPKNGQYVDVVATMNDLGYLDVLVGDDTMVVSLTLTLVTCNCTDLPTQTLQAGVEDDFDPNANNPEVSTPSAALLTKMDACSSGPTVSFDEAGVDRCFGHTFVFETGCLEGAVVEIRMRAIHPLSYNDGIRLGYDAGNNSFAWGTEIRDLPEAAGTGWSWKTERTFWLDVGELAPQLLDQMAQTGALDVFVGDDTSVDHIRLHLTRCCGWTSDGPIPFEDELPMH